MVSVAAQIVAPTTTIKWIAPAPLWDVPGVTLQKPSLAEFTTDSFLADFLNMLAGTGNTPVVLNSPHDTVAAYQPDTIYKLYQPIHQHYYLVTASLVCRHVGLPDRTVVRKNGEKTSFVLRRMIKIEVTKQDGTKEKVLVEAGWVKDGANKGWQPVNDRLERSNPCILLDNEERLSLHQAKYCPSAPTSHAPVANGATPKPCDSRIVYHGSLPVDSREKYLMPSQTIDIQQNIINGGVDPRLDEVSNRVIEPWRSLYVYTDYTTEPPIEKPLQPQDNTKQPDPTRTPKDDLRFAISLNLIVDLGDFLKQNLSNVFNAIMGTGPAGGTSQTALFNELKNIVINTNAGTIALADAIKKLQNGSDLANAESEPPTDTYDVASATHNSGMGVDQSYLALPDVPQQPIPPPPPGTALPGEGTFHQLFREALTESGPLVPIPAGLAEMIKDEHSNGDVYFVRLCYERGNCDPIVSDKSDLFTFAKVFDPDAPARPLRIELPSIKLKDLRKYQRGVGFQMPAELNDLLNRINPGLLKGGGLADAGAPLGIAMICTFSIPIITICALIVLFIFLILLNFIFWWLPFIRICFPIPKPSTGP